MMILIIAAWIVFLAALGVFAFGAVIVRQAHDRLSVAIGSLTLLSGVFVLAVAIHLYHLAGLS